MAYALISVGNTANIPVQSIYCDTEADLDSVPVNAVPVGSVAYIIENGKIFMMNSAQTWKKQGTVFSPNEHALVDHTHELEDITDLDIDEYVRDEEYRKFFDNVNESLIIDGAATGVVLGEEDSSLIDTRKTFNSLVGMTIKLFIDDEVYYQEILASEDDTIFFEPLPEDIEVQEGTQYVIIEVLPQILNRVEELEETVSELDYTYSELGHEHLLEEISDLNELAKVEIEIIPGEDEENEEIYSLVLNEEGLFLTTGENEKISLHDYIVSIINELRPLEEEEEQLND